VRALSVLEITENRLLLQQKLKSNSDEFFKTKEVLWEQRFRA
jgi:hypothetical protein